MIPTGKIEAIIPVMPPRDQHFANRISELEKALKAHPGEPNLIFLKTLVEAEQNSFRKMDQFTFETNEKVPFFKSLDHYEEALNIALETTARFLQADLINDKVKAAIDTLLSLDNATRLNYFKAAHELNMDDVPAEYRLFIFSALHTVLYKIATTLKVADDYLLLDKSLCPCCQSPAISSVIDADDNGLRYLVCSLCETKWHHVRSQCTHCKSSKDIQLISIDEEDLKATAETCGECNVYLKHIDRTKKDDRSKDPFIEDLLTLALDLALNEENFQRLTINPYLG